jgi:hypothetical protein
MELFYLIVAGVAIFVLVIILASMGLMLQYQDNQIVYPPTARTCPDYWSMDLSGNCVFPSDTSVNVGNLDSSHAGIHPSGLTTNSPITSSPLLYAPFAKSTTTITGKTSWAFDPNNTAWGTNSVCLKRQWAKTNNIEWDGISNYNSC